jgi:hypothetical protein
MEQLNIELTPAMLVLVPVVAAIIQMAKKLPIVSKYTEYLPIASLLLGVGGAYLQEIPNPILAGVMIGLTACGAFDVLKGKITGETK